MENILQYILLEKNMKESFRLPSGSLLHILLTKPKAN